METCWLYIISEQKAQINICRFFLKKDEVEGGVSTRTGGEGTGIGM